MIGKTISAAAVAVAILGSSASASVYITEWMYGGANGEFIELTNTGTTAVDLSGWHFWDESNLPGGGVPATVDISSLGTVQPGKSVIITEATASAFRTAWGLDASVAILGSNTQNLGRNDKIVIYDASNTVVDTLDFGDESTPGGTIRTQNRSGGPNSDAVLGTNNALNWSFVDLGTGDPHGAGFVTSTGGDKGNPGIYLVPEPAGLALLGLGGLAMIRRRRAK